MINALLFSHFIIYTGIRSVSAHGALPYSFEQLHSVLSRGCPLFYSFSYAWAFQIAYNILQLQIVTNKVELCVYVFSYSWRYIQVRLLEVGLLGQKVSAGVLLRSLDFLSEWLDQFAFPPTGYEHALFPTFLLSDCIFIFFSLCQSNW